MIWLIVVYIGGFIGAYIGGIIYFSMNPFVPGPYYDDWQTPGGQILSIAIVWPIVLVIGIVVGFFYGLCWFANRLLGWT